MLNPRSLSQGSTNTTVLDVAQTGGHKKRVRRSSFLNAKKLYEDAQMARKVKQYLSNLDLEMDEESLQALSLQCEPASNTCEQFSSKNERIIAENCRNTVSPFSVLYDNTAFHYSVVLKS